MLYWAIIAALASLTVITVASFVFAKWAISQENQEEQDYKLSDPAERAKLRIAELEELGHSLVKKGIEEGHSITFDNGKIALAIAHDMQENLNKRIKDA